MHDDAEPIIPEGATLNQIYGPATQIISQERADAYWEAIVTYHLQQSAKQGIARTREEAEERERTNLAYFTGYYDTLTRARVEHLFKCRHPVFGAVADRGTPTVYEAMLIGIEIAQRMRQGGFIK